VKGVKHEERDACVRKPWARLASKERESCTTKKLKVCEETLAARPSLVKKDWLEGLGSGPIRLKTIWRSVGCANGRASHAWIILGLHVKERESWPMLESNGSLTGGINGGACDWTRRYWAVAVPTLWSNKACWLEVLVWKYLGRMPNAKDFNNWKLGKIGCN